MKDSSKLFRNKYRIGTTRLKHFDYSSNGHYFITICTNNRKYHFGNIINQKIKLNKIGQIAINCWESIPHHFPFVELDEYIIMPNHIHGIIIIDKPLVDTQNFACLPIACLPRFEKNQPIKNKFGPQSKNLASIIRGYKIGVTKWCRNNTNIYDVWQPRYYEHIIRNPKSLQIIRKYIILNPRNWSEDKNR